MKREDFEIPDIPDGYQVYSIDLTPSGRPVAGVAHPNDQTLPAFIISASGALIEAPPELLWPYGEQQLKPRVRAAGEDLVVAQRLRAMGDDEETVRIWAGSGEFVTSFAGGDDCEELLGDADHLLLFYGDEARDRIDEGVAVYSTSGERLWCQANEFPGERIFFWFHAAAWAGPDDVAIWADVQRPDEELQCAYFRLDLRDRSQQVRKPPDAWGMPRAITVSGRAVLVHGASSRSKKPRGGVIDRVRSLFSATLEPPEVDEPHVQETDIVLWLPDTNEWRIIGRSEQGIRGIRGGRFVASIPTGYTILSFDDELID